MYLTKSFIYFIDTQYKFTNINIPTYMVIDGYRILLMDIGKLVPVKYF